MAIIVSWKFIGFVLFYLVYHLNCNCHTAVAIDLSDKSESDIVVDESFEQPRIWSSLLEEMTIK